MNMLELSLGIKYFADNVVWNWPLLSFIIVSGVVMTVALSFVQFRYFFSSWKCVFSPEKTDASSAISPLQAFMNTLSASVGNGALAGMATALYWGGPGAAFWVFVLGFLGMAIRFCEVFAGTYFLRKHKNGSLIGGPMAYIYDVPGGAVLVYVYAFFCLALSFTGGSAMQCNSISMGIAKTLPVDPYMIAAGLFLFVSYIMLGGASRILKVSDAIAPIKVIMFFVTTIIGFVYHYDSLWSALVLIIQGALTPEALAGGTLGFTLQESIRYGMARSLNATEAGLGTAGVLYGGTGSKNPINSGIMAMVTTFISNHLVCFGLMWFIVATGTWSGAAQGIDMTIAAYATVFGSVGSWLVTLLSVMFGLGVLVAYAYIGRECWSFLTGGRYLAIYAAFYCGLSLVGSLAEVSIVWNSLDLVNAGLVIINMYALLYRLPVIRQAMLAYNKNNCAA